MSLVRFAHGQTVRSVALAVTAFAFGLVILRPARAEIVTHGVQFTGSSQTLNYVATAQGTITGEGSGSLSGTTFVLDPNPQTHQLFLDPNPTVFSTHPQSLTVDMLGQPIQTEIDFDTATQQVVGLRNLHLDLFDTPQPVALQTVLLTILLGGSVPVVADVSANGSVYDFHFWQTSPAAINGNLFSLDGSGGSLIDLSVSLFGGALLVFEDTGQPIEPRDVLASGFITTTVLPGGPGPRDVLVELDGTASLGVSVGLNNDIVIDESPAFTVDGSTTGMANVEYAISFHLETVLIDAVVPEPTTWALLVAGGPMAAAAWVWKRRRRSAATA